MLFQECGQGTLASSITSSLCGCLLTRPVKLIHLMCDRTDSFNFAVDQFEQFIAVELQIGDVMLLLSV